MNLPKLAGTEKQVAWAETIRMKYMDKINACRAKVSEKAANPDKVKTLISGYHSFDLFVIIAYEGGRKYVFSNGYSSLHGQQVY